MHEIVPVEEQMQSFLVKPLRYWLSLPISPVTNPDYNQCGDKLKVSDVQPDHATLDQSSPLPRLFKPIPVEQILVLTGFH